MIDLRELMAERSAGHSPAGYSPAGHSPAGGDRLAQVRRRIAVRRRRRTVAGVSGAAVMVGALAAYVVLPGTNLPAATTSSAATSSATAPLTAAPSPSTVARTPLAAHELGPFTEYAHGYRVIATGRTPVSAKQVRLTWTVGSPDVQVFTYCPGIPGRHGSLDAEFAVNGSPTGSINCDDELHQDPNVAPDGTGGGMLSRVGLTPGETVTATYTLTGSQNIYGDRPTSRLPTEGMVHVAVAEKVPFTAYPFPPRPARLVPPHPDGLATEPGARVVRSDPADPNRPVTTSLIWHLSYDVSLIPSTPGIYTVSINGVPVLTAEIYDYRGGGKGISCSVQPGERTCLAELLPIRDGELVSITVTPRHATGPWIAELRSPPVSASGDG